MNSTRQRRTFATVSLVGLVLALVAAFAAAPAALLDGAYGEYAQPGALEDAVALALAGYWDSGKVAFTPPLAELVDYWFWWHAIKVVICLILVGVLVLLAVTISRTNAAARKGSTRMIISSTVVMIFAGAALVVLLANIQSTCAPIVALLQVLPGSTAEGQIISTLTQISHELSNPGSRPPAIGVLIASVERYHWTLAVSAFVCAATVGWVAASAWRRRAASHDRAERRVWLATAIVTTTGVAGLAGVVAISAISALQPAAAVMDVL